MRKSNLTLIVCIVLAISLITGALYLRSHSGQASPSAADKITPPPTEAVQPEGSQKSGKVFTVVELAKFNGKDGNQCYVAVDGTVYEIEQGLLWKDGRHETSNGQAMCGADLSAVIGKSPHGKSKLSTLEVMGKLQP